jgi:hypothetical protein
MTAVTCKVRWCTAKPACRQVLCQLHWGMVPLLMRLELNKIQATSDMQTNSAWTFIMYEAFGLVLERLKTQHIPPHPADRGVEYEERSSRYGVQMRLL